MSRGRRSNPMANNMLGMFGMGGGMEGDLDNEEDLNAELEILLSGGAPAAPKRRAAPSAPRCGGGGGRAPEMSLEAQLAMALRDVPEDDMDDANLEDDPELLAELSGMIEEQNQGGTCTTDMLESRQQEYQMAVAMAESVGDSSKARSCKRAIGTLEELQKRFRRGQTVHESELPPPVSSQPSPISSGPSSQPSPSREAAPPVPKVARPSPQSGELPMLTQRRDEYKVAALTAKRSGEIAEAKRLVQLAKQFDNVITAIEAGQPVDLTNIPPPPTVPSQAPVPAPVPVQTESRQRSAPGAGLSLEEDLRARMEVVQKTQEKAQAEGNASKARRIGRQIAAYKEAITACKMGKQYDYSELALPLGFEPLKPTAASAAPSQPAPASSQPPAPAAPAAAPAPLLAPAAASAAQGSGKSLLEDLQERMVVMQQRAQQQEDPSKARRMGRVVNAYKEAIAATKAGKPYNYSELALPPGFKELDDNAASAGTAAAAARPAPAPPTGTAGGAVKPPSERPVPGKLQKTLSRSTNQTLVFLQERQRLFKEAALTARNDGKKELALTYLRQAKGFDPMIAAAENGLPVDMSKLPPLPGEKEVDFGFLKVEECDNPEDFDTSNPQELYKQLALKLQTQIQLCKANSSRCSRMGDVSTAAKFDRLTKTSMLDLAALRSSETHGDAVPRFHFEWKTFTMESSNPDLGEDVLELQLIRGIDLCVPAGYTADQMDVYMRVELPFPSSEEPQTFTTDVVRRTNNPEFNATHKFNVNKKQRTFQRLVKSRAAKVEVLYKRGLFKGDKVLGVANVKLAELERKSEVHDSFDLFDGRKAIGGRVEARVRLREPIGGKQIEETREKWLVIDATSRPEVSNTPSSAPTAATESVEVMKYELNLLTQRMKNLKAQLTPTMTQTLNTKRQELETKIATQEAMLKNGDVSTLRNYANSISKLMPNYNSEARERLKAGDRDKASVLMTKKKLVEKEVAAIRARMTAK